MRYEIKPIPAIEGYETMNDFLWDIRKYTQRAVAKARAMQAEEPTSVPSELEGLIWSCVDLFTEYDSVLWRNNPKREQETKESPSWPKDSEF